MERSEAIKILTDHGIKPSVQRVEIMSYLLTHHTHPTVEEIHNSLCKRMPTLSRTTVYNTLRMFAEYKAAQMITIDDHRVCYDGMTKPHAHFYCKRCGKVTDIMNIEITDKVKAENISGNVIDETHIYYKGVCAECNKENNNIN